MSAAAPIECFWNGEVFKPVSPYWVRRADKDYVKGEVYRLADQPVRSTNSHNHFFASVENAWHNLPPLMAERFNSPDALRKYALIKGGFCTSESITCPSHADALRVAAFVRPADEFALVTVSKAIVTRYTAKSQSYKAMGKEEFKASKDKVLDIIAELLGVSGNELRAAEPSQREYLGTG
jgi:hypothetical protein